MDDLKLALALNAVAPSVGGVLVRGEKGTAKSTVVRALAALLPVLEAVEHCRFACDPAAPDAECPDGPHRTDSSGVSRRVRLVELPVGAAEDRVVGSLDLEKALSAGVRAFEPGLLAAAHRGVLYVDEVNLLHDHLVDVLLDAAAMGRAHVEREGVSVSHAARFLLVGTMNPEEGELRPQLLDRFGLTVQVAASRDPKVRAEVVRRGLAQEADPVGFAAAWAAADTEFAERIERARALVGSVDLPDAELERIARVCAAFDVDGMRADLVTARAARAHAAWHGRTVVAAADVEAAARLALPHRRRRDPFDAPGLNEDQLKQSLEDDGPEDDGPGGGSPTPPQNDAADSQTQQAPAQQRPEQQGGGTAPTRTDAIGETFKPRLLTAATNAPGVPGRRSPGPSRNGRIVGSTRPVGLPSADQVHLGATLRAAAPHQTDRGRGAGGRLLLRPDDLRATRRHGRVGNLVLFCVDASGSMGARSRMRAVKGAVQSLLRDAYQRRDKVGLVTFRGTGAELVLPPTSSVEAGAARLSSLATGGRTSLAEGLLVARRVLAAERLRDPDRTPLLVVLTDGRANSGANAVEAARRAAGLLHADGVQAIVVDCESGPVRLGLAGEFAAALGAPTLRLDELPTDGLATLVSELRNDRSGSSLGGAA
ncbi:MAG: magnesium chelatase subunit D family protein [Sporichthyaceae bacterium]